jgi:hypothetical protein
MTDRAVSIRPEGTTHTPRADQQAGNGRSHKEHRHHLAVGPVLHLPGMFEEVPGDPAGCVARGPAAGDHGCAVRWGVQHGGDRLAQLLRQL